MAFSSVSVWRLAAPPALLLFGAAIACTLNPRPDDGVDTARDASESAPNADDLVLQPEPLPSEPAEMLSPPSGPEPDPEPDPEGCRFSSCPPDVAPDDPFNFGASTPEEPDAGTPDSREDAGAGTPDLGM